MDVRTRETSGTAGVGSRTRETRSAWQGQACAMCIADLSLASAGGRCSLKIACLRRRAVIMLVHVTRVQVNSLVDVSSNSLGLRWRASAMLHGM